jgi:hypothetical protein
MGRSEYGTEQDGSTNPPGAAEPAGNSRQPGTLDAFFDALWSDYVELTPRAAKIRALFSVDNPSLENDHVAFRTFDRDPIGLERLEEHLLSMGYERFAPYHFAAKKLDAWGYVPVKKGPAQTSRPRIFLSALRVDSLSTEAQRIIDRLCARIDPRRVEDPSVFFAGLLWPIPSWQEYCLLRTESEYAAWLAALGMRANHFTVSVNSLQNPTTLEGVVARVEAAGFEMNEAGGKLKGSPGELLEQAATLADRVRVRFGDGTEHEIPSCYYEFARRYPGSDGKLYPGFVAASADRIFESTDTATSSSTSTSQRQT